MKKLSALLLAVLLAATCVSALADQTGAYTVYNTTGEKVTSLTITDNVTGTVTENLAGEGLENNAAVDVTFAIPDGEDGHGRLTLAFTTESGYEGAFTTLSIEEAPIALLKLDAESTATTITFKVPEQTGKYTVYNTTGEKVTSLTLTDNVTGTATENLAGEGLENNTAVDVTFAIPVTEDGHGRLTLAFTTESGYEGAFTTLSIEEAPIALLKLDAESTATTITFKVPEQTGKYPVYNTTGEKVTSLTLTDNVTGEVSENFAGEGLEDGAMIEITKSLPVTEDGHGRLTLAFTTESGYEGAFTTLSIEEAPISLLKLDAGSTATTITFKAPEK